MSAARILVVEDQHIVSLDIQASLRRLGYAVAGTAVSGEEAIRKAEELRPDLVLMDIILKGPMDGIAAAQAIHDRLDLPLIYLTAHSDGATLERAKVTEPSDYIIKPFEERDLQTPIALALYKHRMEKRLRESEEWFSTTLRSIGDAVLATDAHGSVKFLNPVAEALTGWSRADAVGADSAAIFHAVHEHTRALLANPVAQVLREGTTIRLPNSTVLLARDGSERPIGFTAAPVRNGKGAVTGAVLVFWDVSERRRLEEQLRQAQQVAETIHPSRPGTQSAGGA